MADESTEEFERQPVPESKLLGFRSFIGMYAGEHCAGTELMIGPLFVAAGVSAFDLVVGLIVGNLLAVLSWTLLTAPIATRSRLTLYYQLERICGRRLVTIYNLANGIMFCFLAGSMITVSATAVGVWTGFEMPALNDVYPTSVGWVLAVLAIGAVISVVAALGYEAVSRFANIAAPWMVLVFVVFGLVGLKQFIDATGSTVDSFASLWQLCEEQIWTGGDALPGQTKFTFWHVTFFAWFCNMAMHIGMSDLSVLRFAKKSWYGIASASGMYVGHFMAWISAALLYAYQLRVTPENTGVAPGPLAFQAAGIAGLICVIVAGWTTANPTIYRAGLAFQAIMPSASRFHVTLAAGALATIAGVFPFFAMSLLGFVALYGLVLMPMGAILFVDFYLMRRLGMKENYAEQSGSLFNPAAATAWIATVAICLLFVKFGVLIDRSIAAGILTDSESLQSIKKLLTIELYFVSLPGWFLAAGLYLALSRITQQKVA